MRDRFFAPVWSRSWMHCRWRRSGGHLLKFTHGAGNARQAIAPSAKPSIPDVWDEVRLASLELPLAHAAASPKHVSKEYYASIPVRPIYKSYDVYRPDVEPKGYFEWLKQQEPKVVWDETKSPALDTEADWIRAGEIVFDSPTGWGNASISGPYEGMQVRDPEWYKSTQAPLTANGELPFYRYVIRTKGRVEVGVLSCAMRHTRSPAGRDGGERGARELPLRQSGGLRRSQE